MSPDQQKLFDDYNRGVRRAAGPSRPVRRARRREKTVDELREELLECRADYESARSKVWRLQRRCDDQAEEIKQLKEEQRARRTDAEG